MIIQFICRAILLGVPLLYGSTGEIVTEKSGHLNLGIPGIMYVGAISGVVGSFLYENSCGNDAANMNPFLAVIIPPAKKDKVIAGLIIVCFALSYMVNYINIFDKISSGVKPIVLIVVISTVAALLFPKKLVEEAV